MFQVQIQIINLKSEMGENCLFSLYFNSFDNLINLVDEAIDQTEYRKVDVYLSPMNFSFNDDQIELLEDNDIYIM
jgi:hypothetical protein